MNTHACSSTPIRSILTLTTALMFPLTGCLAPPEEELGTAEQGVLGQNALTWNALNLNGLSQDALTRTALIANSLTGDALTGNALTYAALQDPLGRQFLKYVVSCALPDYRQFDITIDGQIYSFQGQLGLASSWGEPNGFCDRECQGWISGCILSRLNYLGESVSISLRGKHEALATTPQERSDFPNFEATYYGKIFASPPVYHACLPSGATQIPRVCGPSIEDCVIDVADSCEDVCEDSGPGGYFDRCHDQPPDEWGQYPSPSLKGNVSVFLQ